MVGASSLVSLLIRTIILLNQVLILMTSFKPNHFLTPNTATLKRRTVKASTHKFWGSHIHSVHNKFL